MDRIVIATGTLRGRPDDRRLRLDAFASMVGDRIGAPVTAIEVERYHDLLARLGQDVDLAWMAPAVAIRAVVRRGAHLLVSAVRARGSTYQGTIFVRDSSPWTRPEDLRGTRIGWVDPESCAGHLFAKMALVLRGLEPDQLFKEQLWLGSHAAVARAVAERRVDAGATFMNVEEGSRAASSIVTGWQDVTDEAMRPLLVTEPIPADAIVASDLLDVTARESLRAALVTLHELPDGAKVLGEMFHATRLEPTDEKRYASVRAALGADL